MAGEGAGDCDQGDGCCCSYSSKSCKKVEVTLADGVFALLECSWWLFESCWLLLFSSFSMLEPSTRISDDSSFEKHGVVMMGRLQFDLRRDLSPSINALLKISSPKSSLPNCLVDDLRLYSLDSTTGAFRFKIRHTLGLLINGSGSDSNGCNRSKHHGTCRGQVSWTLWLWRK